MSVSIFGDGRIEGIPLNKKIATFTSSGTWTVPAGVTYAIAHMIGGGGGVGNGSSGAGGTSSVAFSGGTVSAEGGAAFNALVDMLQNDRGSVSAVANSGNGGLGYGYSLAEGQRSINSTRGEHGSVIVAGDTVTPGASITVTVGDGGTAGTGASAAGGSGYVYIEYYD